PDCSTGRLYGEIGGGGYRHIRTTGRSQIHLTVVGAHLCAIDCKVHQMASAIGDIGRTLLQSFHKVVIRERSVDFDVCTSPAYSAVGDTWKIGFAGNPCTESYIEGLIPDIQLPYVRCIPSSDEIDRVGIRHIHDVFVRSDTVEARHNVIRQFLGSNREPKAGVGKTSHRAL